MFDSWRGFTEETLSSEWFDKLTEMGRLARGDILKMTTLAASGHPGGSMSSLDVCLILYNMARVDPKDPACDDRDRIIVSHGHISPAVYSSLGRAGFFDVEPAVYSFRLAGTPFEGHVERTVPGCEWDTGNLGQGLSVGIGKALYARQSGQDFHTYVVMGDGEQQKGQISEARRLATKLRMSNLTAIVDYNRLQISGNIKDVMPQDIRAGWEADGWQVIEVDGHNLNEIYSALRQATLGKNKPVMILARTVMGKGVSFMENDESYHGAPIKPDQLGNALKELGGIENDLEQLRSRRLEGPPPPFKINRAGFPDVKPGEPIQYGTDDKLDNRSAFGKALLSVADANLSGDSKPVMAVFDCDLAGSVKTTAFGKKYPDSFFQCGIAEHNTAVVAGSLSAERALSVWAAFGMFGITETYNQARLNDINHTNLKLFCTHSGISVGEDGKTHHCIDYFGLLNSTFGWKLITPADPNQTDSVVRHALTNPGNFAVVMGRSTAPVITDEKGLPFFGEKYEYRYGRMEIIRPGEQVALVTSGNMLAVGLDAWNRLTEQGVKAMLVSVSDWSDLHTNDLEMLGGMQEIIVLEDHVVKTGLGTAIGSALLESGFSPRLTKMGVPRYAPSGKAADLYRILGLNAESVANKVKDISERIGINCEVG